MKPKKAYLDELTTKSKDYKVKVRVLEKRRPKTSPEKVLYQSLLLEDDKGTKMRGALFADQVGIFEDAIKRNRVYEITNAPISPLKPEWKTHPNDLDYQMTFGRRTIVLPADNNDGGDDPNDQDFCPISQLPRVPDYAEMFDVLGVVLFVEDHPRVVRTGNDRETKVREIVLTDHSTPQPLSISVWDELADDDCSMLIPVPGKFRTVGLTALRVSNYRGFSMSTSMSTMIIHSPVGAKAEALASWMTSHQMALTELQSRVFNVKMPIPAQKNVKIAALRSKKAKTTLQDEKHWLEVTIPAAELHKVNAYMGCSHCSKRSSIPPGSAYTCENCSEADCTTEPKITFNCDISDGTGTLPMTAFSSTTEKLFKMSAADIFHMKHADDDQAFSAVQEMLRLKPFKVQVGPSTSLSMSNILQWVVKQVVIDGANDNASGSVTATQVDPSQSQVVSSSKGSQVQTTPPKSIVTDASITSAVTGIIEPAITTTPVDELSEVTTADSVQPQTHNKLLKKEKAATVAASAPLP